MNIGAYYTFMAYKCINQSVGFERWTLGFVEVYQGRTLGFRGMSTKGGYLTSSSVCFAVPMLLLFMSSGYHSYLVVI